MLHFSLQKVRKMLIVLETTLDKSIVLLRRKMTREYFFFSASVQNLLQSSLILSGKGVLDLLFLGAEYDAKMCPLSPCIYKKCYTTVLPRDALKLGSGQFQF